MLDPAVSESRFADEGTGEPLILLHGTLFDHRMFEPQYRGLSDDLRVIAYDLRARNSRGDTAYSLDDLVEDLRAEMDERGIERALVGGMSVGAFVALRFALAYPQRVAGLVLIGCQATALSAADRQTWGSHYESRRGKLVGTEFADAEVKVNFAGSTVDSREELVDAWRRRFARTPGDRLWHEADSWLKMDDVSERLDELGMPTLVIHGADDQGVPLADGELIHERVADSRILILPETGHAANLERPDEVNAAIRQLAVDCGLLSTG